jgi:transporter family-2 protein
MRILYVLLVMLAGTGIALQVAWNSRLRLGVESPVIAALVSLIVSALTLAPLAIGQVMGKPNLMQLSSIPPWAWCGGILGAFYLTASLVALPVLGAALVVTGIVSGQLLCALTLDTLGLFGVPRVPLSIYRILGAAFLILGVMLLQRK